MIYLYDNAIVNDLNKSFNLDNVNAPVVKVISPDQILDIAAQIQNDEITFPVIALERNEPVSIDNTLINFTRKQKGVAATFDTETNNIYSERAIPIKLSYIMTILTTNQIDMDEILRELIFKYESAYFLSIETPYECKRTISFGVSIDIDSGLSKKSGNSEYTESGQLYQSSITLICDGCVLLHYTPKHLTRTVYTLDVS